jgi:hypothetical protein
VPFDAAARLRALANALPRDVPGRDQLASRVLALRGDAAAIEASLTALDDAMLAAAGRRLDDEERAALERAVDRRLDPLRDRFDAAQLEQAAVRLRARELRRRVGLPLLSLFSPDAELPPAGEEAPGD